MAFLSKKKVGKCHQQKRLLTKRENVKTTIAFHEYMRAT